MQAVGIKAEGRYAGSLLQLVGDAFHIRSDHHGHGAADDGVYRGVDVLSRGNEIAQELFIVSHHGVDLPEAGAEHLGPGAEPAGLVVARIVAGTPGGVMDDADSPQVKKRRADAGVVRRVGR